MQSFYRTDNGEVIEYALANPFHLSKKCQPRDITIVSGPDTKRMREAICIDIRIGQGYPVVGAARGMLHE